MTVAGTSGGVPYFSGATTWASSAALASNALVVGGGGGNPPVTRSNITSDNSFLQLGASTPLRFADADSSNYVSFQAPATITSNVTWTLPSADGTSNQVLSTNGSGTLSWATPSGGSGGPLLESFITISQNYTITTGSNGLSAGPVSVATGYAVTIPSGQTWTVLA